MDIMCDWHYNEDDKKVVWYRGNGEMLFSVDVTLDGVTNPTANNAIGKNIELLPTFKFSSSQTIRIHEILEEDNGVYWCNVTILDREYISNTDMSLNVEGKYAKCSWNNHCRKTNI